MPSQGELLKLYIEELIGRAPEPTVRRRWTAHEIECLRQGDIRFVWRITAARRHHRLALNMPAWPD